ncbi:hypothetical protein [Variovorax sp. PAMC26660]|uniref:hypothetical protein n=1 Tax=Variovorax sp. PAMC26660 TaxID=2762322 RepID=UPI00164D1658|nr:hypothetical protein [Variovorax sp. PAMC26660]QNK67187.1 hypothetical protein H7F35_29190 [Variovorax sp. PAMC26660]
MQQNAGEELWPLYEGQPTVLTTPVKRYTSVADLDVDRYIGVAVEALVKTSSDSNDGWPLRVLTEDQGTPTTMYSVFLHQASGLMERIADFSLCRQAVEYAETIMAFQLERGQRWARSGRIFDLYCLTNRIRNPLFLGRYSQPGALRWEEDPANAMVFNGVAGRGETPFVVWGNQRLYKQSWLSAQVLYTRNPPRKR